MVPSQLTRFKAFILIILLACLPWLASAVTKRTLAPMTRQWIGRAAYPAAEPTLETLHPTAPLAPRPPTAPLLPKTRLPVMVLPLRYKKTNTEGLRCIGPTTNNIALL